MFILKLKKTLLFFCVITIANTAMAGDGQKCSSDNLNTHPENVLSCFMSTPSSEPESWQLRQKLVLPYITLYGYQLRSQFWPEKSQSSGGVTWKHRMIVVVPHKIKNDEAILYSDGGVNRDKSSLSLASNSLAFPKWKDILNYLSYLKILDLPIKYGSVLGIMLDNPNQYIAFDDGVPRREDGLVAYSWNKFLDNPGKNAYWPAHLLMAKAEIKAMDLIQSEGKRLGYRPPQHFIVSGASKRGWAAWLTALADKRVNGLIPIVIDVFNMKQNLDHIYHSYGDWPEAFHDYVDQGVVNRFGTDEFKKLAKVEDPISYLNLPDYKERLRIPKLILSASDDQFFPPDSLVQYLGLLPGENTVRMIPNQSHQVNFSEAIKSVVDYYGFFLNHIAAPKITWKNSNDNHDVTVTTDFIPQGNVIMWQADNPKKRDFRFSTTDVRYSSKAIEGDCNQAAKTCTYTFPDYIGQGFTSRFLEFQYRKDKHQMKVTSPAFVTPDKFAN